ncbi:MAG: hypothetical protein QOE97_2391, partial [Pseudonocardiales bacterium]|nr:hypothetical protein [Pseudonocardiales bacterium]
MSCSVSLGSPAAAAAVAAVAGLAAAVDALAGLELAGLSGEQLLATVAAVEGQRNRLATTVDHALIAETDQRRVCLDR